MKKYLGVLLLLSVALISIVYVGSSNVIALADSPTPTPTPTTTPTFASFFNCIFGVRVFPGADPVGTYTVNVPSTGSVSGHIVSLYLEKSPRATIVYLSTTHNGALGNGHELLGAPAAINLPVDSRIGTPDANGYYAINNVPFGHYYVYGAASMSSAINGYGFFVQSVDLNATAPNAVVNINPVV